MEPLFGLGIDLPLEGLDRVPFGRLQGGRGPRQLRWHEALRARKLAIATLNAKHRLLLGLITEVEKNTREGHIGLTSHLVQDTVPAGGNRGAERHVKHALQDAVAPSAGAELR